MDSDTQLINALRSILGEEVQFNCLTETHDEQFLVVEDENNRSIIQRVPDEITFTITQVEINSRIHHRTTDQNGHHVLGLLIINQTGKMVQLLAVDQCVFGSTEPRRCDCLLFDDQFLCFVELKLDVEKWKTASANLNTARKQLTETIRFFRTQLITMSPTVFGFKPEAYAVMRTNVYPNMRSSRNIVFTRFLEKTGVPLFEANVKQF